MPMQNIVDEAKRIEEDATYSSKSHFEAASFWQRAHYWLGIPSALLSGIAGASALSSMNHHEVIAGVLALIVAVLASLNVFLNPQQKAATHQRAGTDYAALRNNARIFHSVECPSHPDAIARLKELGDLRDSLNRKAPGISRRFFERARKGIEAGEAQYLVDKAT